MTLGGLALAVGILVDEATVEVENIHTQMEHDRLGRPGRAARQQRDGRAAAAGDAVHPGGVHPVVLHARGGPGAVRAAVAGGRLRDDRLLPAVQHVRAGAVASGCCGIIATASTATPDVRLRWHRRSRRLRRADVAAALAGRAGLPGRPRSRSSSSLGPQLGHGDLPAGGRRPVPAPRCKAPTGTRIEQTEAIDAGGAASSSARRSARRTSTSRSATSAWSRRATRSTASTCGWAARRRRSLRVALKPGAVRVEELKARLREKLPAAPAAWTAEKWMARGRAGRRGRAAGRGPAAVVRAGRHRQRGDELRLADARSRSRSAARRWPTTGPTPRRSATSWRRSRRSRDLQYGQSLDYPTVEVHDRPREGRPERRDAPRRSPARWSPATSSSRFVVPNYWRDPATGIGYQVQVEIPPAADELGRRTSRPSRSSANGEHAGAAPRRGRRSRRARCPAQIDRYNMRRLVSMTANIAGRGPGPASPTRSPRRSRRPATPPTGVQVDVRGQVDADAARCSAGWRSAWSWRSSSSSCC